MYQYGPTVADSIEKNMPTEEEMQKMMEEMQKQMAEQGGPPMMWPLYEDDHEKQRHCSVSIIILYSLTFIDYIHNR